MSAGEDQEPRSDGWFVFEEVEEEDLGMILEVRLAGGANQETGSVRERFLGRVAVLGGKDFEVAQWIYGGHSDEHGLVFFTNKKQGWPLPELDRPLSQAGLHNLAKGLCRGLAEIHALGVAHGAISPEVLYLEGEGGSVHLRGLMRTILLEAGADPAGRSLRQLDLVQGARVFAAALDLPEDRYQFLNPANPNAAFLLALWHAGTTSGFQDAGEALAAAQALPTEQVEEPLLLPAPEQDRSEPQAPADVAATTEAWTPFPSSTSAPVTLPSANKSRTGLYIGIGAGALVVLTILIVMLGSLGERNARKKSAALVSEVTTRFDEADPGKRFPMKAEEFEAVLAAVSENPEGYSSGSLFRMLQQADLSAPGKAEAAILEVAVGGSLKDHVRARFFNMLASRTEGVESARILKWAAQYGAGQPLSLAAAERVLEKHLGSANVKDVLGLLDSTSPETRTMATRVLKSYLAGSGVDDAVLADELARRFESSLDPGSQAALLTILVSGGSDTALPILKRALHSKDAGLRRSVIRLATDWPDDRIVDVLHEHLQGTGEPAEESLVFQSLIVLAEAKRKRSDEEMRVIWVQLADSAASEDAKLALLGGLGKQSHEWAVDMVEHFKGDPNPKVSDRALDAHISIEDLRRRSVR